MMKHFAATLLTFLLLCATSEAVMAQGSDAWITVAPPGEAFTVRMPQSPEKRTEKNGYGELNVSASVYTAMEGGASYAVWSLKNTNYSKAASLDTETYLDDCADLVWESLLKPLRDKLPDRPYGIAFMAYQNELPDRGLPGREYLIKLDKTMGVTNFYVAGERIYVLVVLNGLKRAPETERFLNSFALPAATLPGAPVSTGDAGLNPGSGTQDAPVDDNDPNRIYNGREVTQKARIISKPLPQYTESARKYQVRGTVVIRAVLSKEGEVTNIKAVTSLPHGLKQNAIAATRQIKFIPAMKDGRPVSQYVQVEYNFNLY